tara:strand:+ start:379 stop:675 length:297 start_codon:yes stop_codon:yes gene_type:complete
MVEWLKEIVGPEFAYAAIGGVSVLVAYILKKIPNHVLKGKFGSLMYGLGVALTLGLAKWKFSKKVWHSLIEPWVVDAMDNIVAHGIREFIRGLRSDNV